MTIIKSPEKFWAKFPKNNIFYSFRIILFKITKLHRKEIGKDRNVMKAKPIFENPSYKPFLTSGRKSPLLCILP